MTWSKLLLPLLTASLAHASFNFNVNAIINPGAESSIGSILNDSIVSVPFWTGTGAFTITQYTETVNSTPRNEDPGPTDRGLNFFSGGPGTINPFSDNHSTGDQFLNVSNQSVLIDSGKTSFLLSGWLGGWFNQTDQASFSAIFEDSVNKVLGMTTIGPETPAARSNVTGLFYNSTLGFIPAGTRTIDFHITFDKVQGSHNDGYADNLSFIAYAPVPPPGPGSVPEPGTAGMLGLALVLVATGLRLRRPVRRKEPVCR